ncbi:MAG: primosomal protein N' [Oscillospiraceae bacterium]|nr:primosomal protein N' [Oscillospiraceae bacterium]
MVAKLALAAATYAIDQPYDYLVPAELVRTIRVGMRVLVPFSRGNRVTEGVVLSLQEESDYPNCKEILRPADEEVLLSEKQLQLSFFMRERYFCTVYEALHSMIPAGYWFGKNGRRRVHDQFQEMARLKAPADEALSWAENRRARSPKQAEIIELLASFETLPVRDLLHYTASGRQTLKRLEELDLVEFYTLEIYRRPDQGQSEAAELPTLNAEQKAVLEEIRMNLKSGKPGLLQGVTGSGKTSIYAHLIADTLASGRSAILLVPEIALTPQIMQSFVSWFGDLVAMQHSGLSAGERYDEWKRIHRGKARLVLGTRSAVFAPAADLGLIILDEEQEDSYRSESSPRYHAREIARYRCLQEDAFLLLGSATPELRSRYLAEQGAYSFYRLSSRYNCQPLPPVRIIDMKKELEQGNGSDISRELRNAILERIDRGEQSILFLNRRGTNKLVTCSGCGFVYHCPHCSVSMTWHAGRRRLICHYCGTSVPLEHRCPSCGGELCFVGAGTQKIEQELKEIFPETEVLRVDADSVAPVGSHRELFRRFSDERIPIMVGTQMIAKGLNFDRVTLVGILSADQSLYSNDYRAGERSFSLFTQVIGRCGRAERPGEAFIQTFTPGSEIIGYAAKQDYESFYRSELSLRQIQNSPPFRDWTAFTAVGKEEEKLIRVLQQCRARLEQLMATEGAQIFGPVPLTVVRVNDRFRYRIQISCTMTKKIRLILASLLRECAKDSSMRGIRFYIENDPGD